MVLRCLHYNYNNSETCTGSYEQCAKPVDCPSDSADINGSTQDSKTVVAGPHCFVVWQTGQTAPISAGCNPPYPSADEKCGSECIGQPKGQRWYCCCTRDFCNQKFSLPPPQNQTTNSTIPSDPISENLTVTDTLLIIIPTVLILIVVGAFIYRFRQKACCQTKNRRSQNDVNGDLTHRELNDLRNNHDTSVLTPFRNTFGDENIFNNSNQLNNNNNSSNKNNSYHSQLNIPLTNQHDAGNNVTTRQQLDLNSVKLLEIIGSGRFGTVHRACLEGSIDFAVKIIPSSEHQSWLSEQKIYSSPKVRHPNILTFFHSHEHVKTDSYWLLVEYAPKGSLYSFLKENTVTWNEFLKIALGIVHGLSHLHEADIAHRDFKSKNVLLRHDLTPCITDFGVAVMLDTSTGGSQLNQRKKYSQVGTPRYMAPEVLECSVTFTKASFTKIDVYALSLVLWELISRWHPLPKLVQTHYGQSVLNNQSYSLEGQASVTVPTDSYPPPPPSPQHIANYESTCPPPLMQQQQQDQQNMTSSQEQITNHELSSDHEVARINQVPDSNQRPTPDASPNTTNTNHVANQGDDSPPPFKLPFEDIAGPHPEIMTMRQIVVVDKLRPPLREEWRIYPASEFCRAIEDGWEYDHDARISASCFVERVESLPQYI